MSRAITMPVQTEARVETTITVCAASFGEPDMLPLIADDDGTPVIEITIIKNMTRLLIQQNDSERRVMSKGGSSCEKSF